MKRLLIFAVVAVAAMGMAQQGGGRQGFGQRMGGGNSMIGLLGRPDVQAELKLTDDQKTKLQPLIGRRGGGQPGQGGQGGQQGGQRGQGGQGGQRGQGGQGGNGDPAQMAQQQAEREKQVFAILTPEQAKRLKELFVQRAGNRSLSREDIQKELGFSDEQKAKVRDLLAKQREAQQKLMERVRNQEIERDQVRELMTANETALTTELGKVLTESQAAKFKTMGGAPFKFQEQGGGN